MQQHQRCSHTPLPHGRQVRRCALPDPNGPGNLAISDGQHVARSVPPCDIGRYFANKCSNPHPRSAIRRLGCVRTPDVDQVSETLSRDPRFPHLGGLERELLFRDLQHELDSAFARMFWAGYREGEYWTKEELNDADHQCG